MLRERIVNQYKSWSGFVVTARFPNIWENGCVCVNELWITGFKQVTTACPHGNQKNMLEAVYICPDFCPDLWVTGSIVLCIVLVCSDK